MYVREDADACYLAHPRTASKATAWALTHRRGFRRMGSHHGARKVPGGWTVFTTVRHHGDAVCSWARYLNEPPQGPEAWNRWCRTEGAPYVDRAGASWRLWWHLADGVRGLRFERLQADLDRVLASLDLEPVELPSWYRTRGPGKHTRDDLSGEMRGWIRRRFGPEMDRLGYTF